MIHELTNEYRGVVRAWVNVHANEMRGKFAVFRGDRIFLACLETQFAIILDINFVNIREMIYMYDEEKVAHTELPEHIAVLVNDC